MRSLTVATTIVIFVCHGLVAQPASAETTEPGPTDGNRSVDVQLHPVLSFPNLLGVCLEAFPGSKDTWSSTTCASIGVIGVGPNTNVQYRWSLYQGDTLSLSVGPGLGPRAFLSYRRGSTGRPVPGEPAESTSDEVGIVAIWGDAFASLEAVWWGDTLGFTAQLDLGATMRLVEFEESEAGSSYVLANFTVGLAFR